MAHDQQHHLQHSLQGVNLPLRALKVLPCKGGRLVVRRLCPVHYSIPGVLERLPCYTGRGR